MIEAGNTYSWFIHCEEFSNDMLKNQGLSSNHKFLLKVLVVNMQIVLLKIGPFSSAHWSVKG